MLRLGSFNSLGNETLTEERGMRVASFQALLLSVQDSVSGCVATGCVFSGFCVPYPVKRIEV